MNDIRCHGSGDGERSKEREKGEEDSSLHIGFSFLRYMLNEG